MSDKAMEAAQQLIDSLWDGCKFVSPTQEQLAPALEAYAQRAVEACADALADMAGSITAGAKKYPLGAHINGGPLHGTAAYNLEMVRAQAFIEAASLVSDRARGGK